MEVIILLIILTRFIDEQRLLHEVYFAMLDRLDIFIANNPDNCDKEKALRIKIQNKSINIIKDLRKRIISFLVNNSNHIIIPQFNESMWRRKYTDSQGNVEYKKRGLQSSTVRMLLAWGHRRFLRDLIRSANLYGVKVHVTSEAYTTKQCGGCNKLNKCSGESYTCECGYCCLRDIHGARNIFIRLLSLMAVADDFQNFTFENG